MFDDMMLFRAGQVKENKLCDVWIEERVMHCVSPGMTTTQTFLNCLRRGAGKGKKQRSASCEKSVYLREKEREKRRFRLSGEQIRFS